MNKTEGKGRGKNGSMAGIVLAAGYSSRMASFKPALMLGGKSLLLRTIEPMMSVCERIILVTGFKAGAVNALVEGVPNLETVFNPDFAQGMFTSVKTGIKRVREDYFFICPGDFPLIPPGVYLKMGSTQGDIVLPVFNGRKGHPVLIKTTIGRKALTEPDSSNLKVFLQKHSPVLIEVEDEGILLDLDTVKDYDKMKKRFDSHP